LPGWGASSGTPSNRLVPHQYNASACKDQRRLGTRRTKWQTPGLERPRWTRQRPPRTPQSVQDAVWAMRCDCCDLRHLRPRTTAMRRPRGHGSSCASCARRAPACGGAFLRGGDGDGRLCPGAAAAAAACSTPSAERAPAACRKGAGAASASGADRGADGGGRGAAGIPVAAVRQARLRDCVLDASWACAGARGRVLQGGLFFKGGCQAGEARGRSWPTLPLVKAAALGLVLRHGVGLDTRWQGLVLLCCLCCPEHWQGWGLHALENVLPLACMLHTLQNVAPTRPGPRGSRPSGAGCPPPAEGQPGSPSAPTEVRGVQSQSGGASLFFLAESRMPTQRPVA